MRADDYGRPFSSTFHEFMRESDDRGSRFNGSSLPLFLSPSLLSFSISLVLIQPFAPSTWLLNTTAESLPGSSSIYEPLVIYRTPHSLSLSLSFLRRGWERLGYLPNCDRNAETTATDRQRIVDDLSLHRSLLHPLQITERHRAISANE